MTVPPEQQEVARFLAGLTQSKPSETHISLVFVGEDTVWKLKKAVALSFLDFTDLKTRRRLCFRELEINMPAAPDLYRDAVPIIRGSDGTLSLGTADDDSGAVDWVLRMARVPPGDFLDEIAKHGGLDAKLLDELADTVAEYHQRLAPVPNSSPKAAMRRVLDGNLRAARAAGLDPSRLDRWLEAIIPVMDGLSGWFDRRGAEGWVRRGHGDLHLGNLCLWHGRPVAFDALEFDEDLATIDLGYDLAFLLMDLDRRVGRPAANRVLNRYIARTGDADLLAGLPVFLSMRAMIRAHVEATRGNAGPAGSYLAAALDYLRPAPMVIVAIGGLPGAGKSTLARALAPGLGLAPGALIPRSDEIRKRLNGAAPEAKLPPSAYDDATSARVFAELTQQSATAARAGQAVIADATFIDPQHRAALQEAANAAGVPFIGLWLEAPLDVLAARIKARRDDASDATLAVLQAAAKSPDAQAGGWIAIPATDHDAALAAARKAVMSLPGMC
jgi:aminoglycoside phosphotransferase family enzyme/predicted kinase